MLPTHCRFRLYRFDATKKRVKVGDYESLHSLVGGHVHTRFCRPDESDQASGQRAVAEREGSCSHLISVDIVDSAHAGPEFVGTNPGQRVGGLLARVGTVPLVTEEYVVGVRGVLEWIIAAVNTPLLHGADLLADVEHGIAEAVELL